MITKVKVDTFKDTGKWYDNYEFETETPVWDNQNLQKEIEEQFRQAANMSYVYTASAFTDETDKYEAVNHRLVIKSGK